MVNVVVVAGAVDGEAPDRGGAEVAQSAQAKNLTIGQDAVDVGEAGAVAHPHVGQRSRARVASRRCSELLVESGIFGTRLILGPWGGGAPPWVDAGREERRWRCTARIGWCRPSRTARCSCSGPARSGARTAMCSARGSCWPPRRAWRTRRSPDGWESVSTRCASGGPGSAPRGWPTGPAAGLSGHGRGRGQGAGLRAAGGGRGAAGPVECRGPGRRGRQPRGGEHHLGRDGGPVAGRRRHPSLAAPVVDLSPGSGLRRQGRSRPGPLRPDLARPAAR